MINEIPKLSDSVIAKLKESALPPLTAAVVEDLKRQGLNQSEIARLYNVTRAHISWIKTQYGGSRTAREEVLRHFPFEVSAAQQTSPYKRLRDHAEFFATRGKGMSEDKLKRLRSFYQKLRTENTVVEYDPSIPPCLGVSNTGGWAFRERLPEDGDLLIRVNEFTDLTEQGKMIWRFPPVEP